MFKNRFLYLLGLIGALVFHTFYFGWFSWFVLVLVAVLPLFSLLVSLPAMLRLRLELQTPAFCTRNEAAYVTMRTAGGFLPLPRCRFRLKITAQMTGRTEVSRQRMAGHDSWYVALNTAHCGVLRCAVERVRVYDYLSLLWLPVRAPKAVEIVVQPVPVQPEPLPNLSQFLARRHRPKPGGGFSEEHELRDYRPGDSMKEIHWKLSVKTDRVIVREAQEPIRGLTLLTFDLQGEPEQVDYTLEQLVWLSQWLLEHETPHQIIWIDPDDCQMATIPIETQDELQLLLNRLLRTPLRPDTPSIAGRSFASASWRYHVQPEQGVTP